MNVTNISSAESSSMSSIRKNDSGGSFCSKVKKVCNCGECPGEALLAGGVVAGVLVLGGILATSFALGGVAVGGGALGGFALGGVVICALRRHCSSGREGGNGKLLDIEAPSGLDQRKDAEVNNPSEQGGAENNAFEGSEGGRRQEPKIKRVDLSLTHCGGPMDPAPSPRLVSAPPFPTAEPYVPETKTQPISNNT